MKKLMLSVAVGCAVLGAADTLTFKSGAKLLGTVVRVEGGTITFKSDDVGELSISADKVAELSTDKENTILFTDKTREEAIVGMTDGKFTAGEKPLDMDKVKAINPEAEAWHGNVNIGVTAARGNTVSEDVSIVAGVSRRWEHDRFTADGSYNWAQNGTSKDTKEKTKDKITLAAQEDHFISEKFYIYANGKFERDTLNDLSSRYRIGGGFGRQWLDGQTFEATGKWSFSQEAGAEYVKERLMNSDDNDDNYASFRYKHNLVWNPKWVKDVEVFHHLEYHPEISDWSNYVINTDIGASTTIWGGWNLLAKFEWDYDSEPADSAKKSDLRYILGLGYKW